MRLIKVRKWKCHYTSLYSLMSSLFSLTITYSVRVSFSVGSVLAAPCHIGRGSCNLCIIISGVKLESLFCSNVFFHFPTPTNHVTLKQLVCSWQLLFCGYRQCRWLRDELKKVDGAIRKNLLLQSELFLVEGASCNGRWQWQIFIVCMHSSLAV